MDRLDIVVFGASGFTGGFVVTELAKVAAVERLTWGVAGRDEEKLLKAIRASEDETGLRLDGTRIILTDVNNPESLRNMCQQATVILNCVGPYRFYGEPVVKACIATGTHHLDISGEPEYLEKMEYLYDTTAAAAGVYVVGACGFDSIPADIGVIFMRDNFKGELQCVEGFINIKNSGERVIGNYGTYESAVYSIANWSHLSSLRRTIAEQKKTARAVSSAWRPPSRGTLFTVSGLSGCYTPAPGADGSVVYRTQRFVSEYTGATPVHTRFYFGWSSVFVALVAGFFATIFTVMARFSIGRRLLLNNPGFFSGGLVSRRGPSRRHIAASSFSLTLLGKGAKRQPTDAAAAAAGKKCTNMDVSTADIVARVRGPEIGYVTTVICLIQAGLTILKEKSRLPKRGGVYTPGSIFAKTTLADRLTANGVIFEIVKPQLT